MIHTSANGFAAVALLLTKQCAACAPKSESGAQVRKQVSEEIYERVKKYMSESVYESNRAFWQAISCKLHVPFYCSYICCGCCMNSGMSQSVGRSIGWSMNLCPEPYAPVIFPAGRGNNRELCRYMCNSVNFFFFC